MEDNGNVYLERRGNRIAASKKGLLYKQMIENIELIISLFLPVFLNLTVAVF